MNIGKYCKTCLFVHCRLHLMHACSLTKRKYLMSRITIDFEKCKSLEHANMKRKINNHSAVLHPVCTHILNLCSLHLRPSIVLP